MSNFTSNIGDEEDDIYIPENNKILVNDFIDRVKVDKKIEQDEEEESDTKEEENENNEEENENENENDNEDEKIDDEDEDNEDDANEILEDNDLEDEPSKKIKEKKNRIKRRRDNPVLESEIELLEENLGRKIERVRNVDDDVYINDEDKNHRRLRKMHKSQAQTDVSSALAPEQIEEALTRARNNNFASLDNENEDDFDFIVDENDNRVSLYADEKNDNFSLAQSLFGDFDFSARKTVPMSSARRALLQKRQELMDKHQANEDAEDDEVAFEQNLHDLNDEIDQLDQDDKPSLSNLKQLVDPSFLARKFLSEEDEHAKVADIPERLQERWRLRGGKKSTDEELQEEAAWIHINAFHDKHDVIKSSIVEVLRFLRSDLLEVPHIATYKVDYWKNLPSKQSLWIVDIWDEKWDILQSRKNKVLSTLSQIAPNDVSTKLSLMSVASVLDLDDYQMYIRYLKKIQLEGDKNLISINFSNSFTISPNYFGDNLSFASKMYTPADPIDTPEVEAAKISATTGISKEDIISQTKQYITQSLISSPSLRLSIRTYYFNHANISVALTEKGKSMDWLHPYYPIKWLKNKPLNLFERTTIDNFKGQFALLEKSEKEGFIKIVWSCGGFESSLIKYFNSQSESKIWNPFRAAIISDLLKNWTSMCEQYCRARLRSFAYDEIASVVSHNVELMIDRQPFKFENRTPTVVSILSGGGGVANSPVYVAVLDPFGLLLDSLTLKAFLLKSRAESVTSLREDDRAKLQELIRQYQPEAVVIEGSLEFKNEIEQIVKLETSAVVKFSYLAVSKVYMNSFKAKSEFPDRHPSMRQTISLGRYFQDPIKEMCHIWEEQFEAGKKKQLTDISSNPLLSLSFSPYQSLLPLELLTRTVRNVLISAVCSIGIDINSLFSRSYSINTLQFICGMGPRKMDAFHRAWQTKGAGKSFYSRQQLNEFVGPNVFLNLAGFLSVLAPKEDIEEDSEKVKEVTWLDTTRIHPDHYNLARQVVFDSLDIDMHENLSSAEIEEVLTQITQPAEVGKLDTLDLMIYAQKLEEDGMGKLVSVFDLMVRELKAPFRDIRPNYCDLNAVAIFWLLNEGVDVHFVSESRLKIGQLVTGTITRHAGKVSIAKIGNCTGIIEQNKLPEQPPFTNNMVEKKEWQDRIAPINTPMQFRVLEINYDTKELILTATPSDISDRRHWEKRKDFVDPYFVEEWDAPAYQASAVEKKSVVYFQRRTLNHPLFRNWSSTQTIDELLHVNVHQIGDCIFRPSTIGSDHLTLSWKFAEDCVLHVDIVEKQKTTADALGKQLFIGQHMYEDLDHIIAEYLVPMSRILSELYEHGKYRQGKAHEIKDMLHGEKRADASRTPYFIWLDYSSAERGVLTLSCLPQNSTRDLLVSVTPEGFILKDSGPLKTVTHLCTYFKTHFAKLFSADSHRPREYDRSRESHDPYYSRDRDSRDRYNDYPPSRNYSSYPPNYDSRPPPPPPIHDNYNPYDRRMLCSNCGLEGHTPQQCRAPPRDRMQPPAPYGYPPPPYDDRSRSRDHRDHRERSNYRN